METFQYDWRDKKVTSQFLLVETRESAKKFVDEAIKEYTNTSKTYKLEVDEDDRYIYRIHVSSIEGLTSESDFFIGFFKRHVHSPQETDELLQYTSWQHRGDKVENIKVKDEHMSIQTREDDFNQFSTF